MARRRKSVNDIMDQAASLMTRSGNNWSRVDKLRRTAFRYSDNIRHSAKKWNYDDDSSYKKKYPRRVYMGLGNANG